MVSVTVWLLDWARGHLRAHGRLVGEAARASYATHLVHPLVLTAVGVMPAAVPPATELKFVLVSPPGILTHFTAGWIMTKLQASASSYAQERSPGRGHGDPSAPRRARRGRSALRRSLTARVDHCRLCCLHEPQSP